MSSQLLLRLLLGEVLMPDHLTSTEDKSFQRRDLPQPTLLQEGETGTRPPFCKGPSTGYSRPSSPFTPGSQRISMEKLLVHKRLLRSLFSHTGAWSIHSPVL